MSQRDDLDRMLGAWLDDPYTEPAPRILGRVLERTSRTRQRRAWASLERWLPMSVITRPGLAPSLRAAWLLLIALLAVALAAGGVIVGSRLLTPNGPDLGLRGGVAIPQGDEAVFAFASWVGDANDNQVDGDIFTVRADGSDRRQLTDGPAIDSEPTWSPDGARIAFHRWQDGVDSVIVMDAGGGGQVTLATNDQGQDCLDRRNPAWSPDGSSLIFTTRDDCATAYDLSIVAADGSSPATRLLAPGMASLYAAWSPDARHLAFLGSEATGDAGLYVVDATPVDALAGNLEGRRIATDLGVNLAQKVFGIEFSQPRWSPDGTEVAVAPATDGFQSLGDAIAVKADGSGQRLIAERAYFPVWSPDGEQLTFHRTTDRSEWWNDRPCTVRTWIVDADGTQERSLDELTDGCASAAVWSPDGTRLARVLITGTPDDPELAWHLGIAMADGSRPPVVLQDAYGTWQPVVAPLPPAPSFAADSPAP